MTEEKQELLQDLEDAARAVSVLVGGLRQAGAAVDPRWVSIGTTDLQKGFDALRRSINQPETF